MENIEGSIKPINDGLSRISDYLVLVQRDTQKGWYYIEVGIPSDWIFDSNDIVECEILQEGGGGKLVKISPKNDNVYVDDLITFVEVINTTNKKILEKEALFTDKMEQMKTTLQNEALKFYKELDEMKKHSFETISSKLDSDTLTEPTIEKITDEVVTEPTIEKITDEVVTEPTIEKSTNGETTKKPDQPDKQAIDKE
jgi:hypothetical protein